MKNAKRLLASFRKSDIKRHLIALLVAIVVVSLSVYGVASSQAAPTIYSILNYSNADKSTGVSDVSVNAESIVGQTVNKITPGAKLTYKITTLSYINSQCYYFVVLPQNGNTTAKVEFGGIGSTATINVSSMASGAQLLQRACIDTVQGGSSGFNVYNLSPANGPDILVYQDILNQPTYLASVMGATNCENVTEDVNTNIQAQASAFVKAYESGGTVTLPDVLVECGQPTNGFVVQLSLTANDKSISDTQDSYVSGGPPEYKYTTTCNLTYISAASADISCEASPPNGMPAEEFNLFE